MSLDLLDRNVLIEKTVSMLTHEVRTPLNIVLGTEEQLAQTDLNSEQRGFLAEIRKAALSLLMLANDVYDLEMYATQTPLPEPNACNLSEFSEALALLLNQRTLSQEIRIKLHIDTELPSVLLLDQDKLAQVLINLCSMCLSHDDTTDPLISFNRIEDEIEPKLQIVFTAICQTSNAGVPFSKPDQDIDELLHSTDEIMVRKILLCQRLVQCMGGRIGHQYFETGSCSELKITLPLKTASIEIPEAKLAHNTRILLVEDSPANQMVATAMLNNIGFENVDLADHGEAALQLATEQDYDLVFMDIQMPGIDGLETTRQLRKMGGQWLQLPIIAMTANVMPGERSACIEAGMNDFIGKPVRKEILEKTVGKHLQLFTENTTESTAQNDDPFSGLIDEKVVTDLESSVPPEIAHKMFTTFLLEMNQRIEAADTAYKQLEQKSDDGAWAILTREYHTLKSLCGTFGATGMQEIALELELAAKEKQLSEAEMQRLVRRSKRVNDFFSIRLANASS